MSVAVETLECLSRVELPVCAVERDASLSMNETLVGAEFHCGCDNKECLLDRNTVLQVAQGRDVFDVEKVVPVVCAASCSHTDPEPD